MTLPRFDIESLSATRPRSKRSFQPGLERVESRCLAAAGVGSLGGVTVATQVVHESQLTSYAVITVRNNSGGPVNFDVRVLPHFPRFEPFHLAPGHQRAFFSFFRPGIDSPQFQVQFDLIPGRPITKVTRTLTVFNVLQRPPHFVPTPAEGRPYAFQRTGIDTRDLLLG
ncbi:MAG TPA: hypothetical protein VGZ22_23930 [Isosphaeraceae bacterium]|jgi:hypothetical protein|nr:hypothetical protein [Isosphaeraceae bacterium]